MTERIDPGRHDTLMAVLDRVASAGLAHPASARCDALEDGVAFIAEHIRTQILPRRLAVAFDEVVAFELVVSNARIVALSPRDPQGRDAAPRPSEQGEGKPTAAAVHALIRQAFVAGKTVSLESRPTGMDAATPGNGPTGADLLQEVGLATLDELDEGALQIFVEEMHEYLLGTVTFEGQGRLSSTAELPEDVRAQISAKLACLRPGDCPNDDMVFSGLKGNTDICIGMHFQSGRPEALIFAREALEDVAEYYATLPRCYFSKA